MFKLIFKIMVITVFTIFLIIGIAVWKGGAPFRWLGEKTVNAGNKIQKIGDYIDDIKTGSQKVKKTYNEIKEIVSPEKEKEKTDGTIDKRK